MLPACCAISRPEERRPRRLFSPWKQDVLLGSADEEQRNTYVCLLASRLLLVFGDVSISLVVL